MAGALAGLVFAGIVLLLSTHRDHDRRANALVVFGGAFLVLAIDAFLFGVVSGERICGRVWTEMVFAGGLFGLGALDIFAGICWLIDASDREERRATRFYLTVTTVVALIVGYHVAITVHDYLQDLAPYADEPSWLLSLVNVYEGTILVAVLLIAAVMAVRRRARRPRPEVSHRFVIMSAYTNVLCVLVAAYMSGRGSRIPASDWQHVAAGEITWMTLVALTFPGVAIVMQLFALPLGRVNGEAS